MGEKIRYSFFSIGFAGSYDFVHANDGSSDLLPSQSSGINDTDSGSVSSAESVASVDPVEYQSEENQDAVNSEQDIVPDSLLSSDVSSLGIAVMANDSWTWPTYNFWTQYGDLGNPANPIVRIGPGFTNWSLTGLGMPGEEKVYRDTMMRALQNAFGATNGRINGNLEWINQLWDWETTGRARVNNLWTWSSGVDKKNTAQDTTIASNYSQASTWNTDRYNEISGIWTVNKNQDTSISGLQTDLKAWTSQTSLWNTQRYNEISGIWGVNTTQDKTIAKLREDATQWNFDRNSQIEAIWGVDSAQDKTIASNFAQATTWNTERYNEIMGVSSESKSRDTAQDITIANLRKDANQWNLERNSQIEAIWGVDSAQDKTIASNFAQATTWNTERYNEIMGVSFESKSRDTAQDKTIASNFAQATTWNTERYKEIMGVSSESKSRDAALSKRLDEIESFDFGSIIDLTILVTAINAVGSKVQDLINVFDVTDPKPDSLAFFLQANFKTQTDAITQALSMVDESLNDNFVNYFSDSKNGQFWTAYKEFSDFQMAVFFGVFFESLQEDWEANWLTVLDVWNTTNSFLATIAGWLDQIQLGIAESKEILSIITNWLKLIYEKPVPSFNVPSFDYVRLENMLKKLEFGEVVNEAGTNIWDFLTSIIDNLGDIITTQLEEFTKVLSEILDFLDGLIDKMIGLIVPKNLDFMGEGFDDINLKFKAKFGDFLNISASITQMFQPIEKDFISELSFDFMGVPFVPDITILAAFVPKFRNVVALLMWFNVGWWAFRRFTGTGDVVNDN